MRKRVLIFYISKYSGHYQAAKAIEEALMKSGTPVDVEKINALDYTNPILGRIINRAYLHVIKRRPEIWGNMYDNPSVLKKTRMAREALHRFNMTKIKRLVEKKRPDVILCTQAFPCGMVADFKKATGSDLKLIGVLTDRAAHSYWLFDDVDHYIVPDDDTASVMKAKGVSENKIKVFGIPVSPEFKVPHDRRRVMKELGFSEKYSTILIMGGSQGLGAIEEAVKTLGSDETHHYQLIVVTGKNKKLFSRLTRIASGKKLKNVKVLSFVENISELMEASDIIITKAGGMTTSEALVKKLPMIIVDPIPGHERMNTDYLIRKGAAIEISDYGQMYETINRVFDTSGMLDGMRSSAAELSKPDSAKDLAKLVLSGD
jgi:processive 1,2-diacylglycerol beta-glucosyltransferase